MPLITGAIIVGSDVILVYAYINLHVCRVKIRLIHRHTKSDSESTVIEKYQL